MQVAAPEEGGHDVKGNPSEGCVNGERNPSKGCAKVIGNHPSEERGCAPISFQTRNSHLMNFIANYAPHVSDHNEYPNNIKHHLGKNRAQFPLRKQIGNDIETIRLNMNEQWNINVSNKTINEILDLNRNHITNDLQMVGKEQERQNENLQPPITNTLNTDRFPLKRMAAIDQEWFDIYEEKLMSTQ